MVFTVEGQPRGRVVGVLPGRPPGPCHQAEEDREARQRDEAADVVQVHGRRLSHFTCVPSACRYATSASISLRPFTASALFAMSASLYGTPSRFSAASRGGTLAGSTALRSSQG